MSMRSLNHALPDEIRNWTGQIHGNEKIEVDHWHNHEMFDRKVDKVYFDH